MTVADGRPHDLPSRAPRLSGWVLAAGLLAWGPAPLEAQPCLSLDAQGVRLLAPDGPSVEALQAVLVSAYPEAPEVQAGPGFVDGLIGVRTVALVRRLCTDLGLDDTPSPGPLVMDGANAFGEAVRSHPDWRLRIGAPEFLAWADSLPAGQLTPYYRIGSEGPVAPTSALLLDAFLAAGRLSAASDDVYRVTDDVLAALAAPPESVTYRLSSASLARLRALGAPTFLVDAADALRELPVETPTEVEDQIRSLVNLLGSSGAVGTTSGPSPVDTAVAPAPPTVGPLPGTTPPPLTEEALRSAVDFDLIQPLPGFQGVPVPPDALAGLATLAGVLFADSHLFLQAIRIEAGIGTSRPELQARVLAAARVQSAAAADRSVDLRPIMWEGICGCGTFVKDSDEYPLYVYGMYPFWKAPQGGADVSTDSRQAVDFSMLTRVGYYGLTFDERGVLSDPLHWRTGGHPSEAPFWRRQHFDDFVVTAHRYQTDVDLVLTKGDWESWLPPLEGSTADSTLVLSRNRAALERLADEAVGAITPTLDDLVDLFRPIVSLGQSARRTLGDGVTLDLQVQALGAGDQEWLFGAFRDTFFPLLRKRLDERGRPGFLLNLAVPYALNLVVPGPCLSLAWGGSAGESCTFYSPAALAELEPFLDLILVDFSREPSTPGAWAARPSELELVRGLQGWLDALPLEAQLRMRGKILPLVVPESGESFRETTQPAFVYSGWNFSGAALWSVPVDSTVNRSLEEAMRPEPRPSGGPLLWQGVRDPVVALGIEGRICDFVCPNRWLLRTAVGAAILLVLGLWLATSWWFEFRWIWRTRWIPIGTLAVAAALVATLWCDPFWSERRSGILLASLGGLFVAALLSWHFKRREREYP